jgi:hypothetical protein
MHTMQIQLDEAQAAIREVRTMEDPAVQRLVASASALSDTVTRLVLERVWG